MVTTEYASVESENGISLAARIYKPDDISRVKQFVLVLTHQYSVLGGCQALLKGMASELARLGYITLTFDMRGVGRSTGRPSITGSSEVQDVVAVCRWAAENIPATQLVLIGSSAGEGRVLVFVSPSFALGLLLQTLVTVCSPGAGISCCK